MGNTMSSVLVNGRTMNFSGNFGFRINNQEYSAKDGKVYNSNGQPLKELKMPGYIAEQFFAMSEVSTYDKQENTFTQSDIDFAADLQNIRPDSSKKYTAADIRLKTLTGTKGKVQNKETTVNHGIFSSEYKSNETNRVSAISVWINE